MTTRKDCKHYRLDCAHRDDVEETDITYTYPGDDPRRAKGLIEWLAEEKEPVGEVFEDTDPGLNVLRLDLDPHSPIPRTTEDELSRLNGFSFSYFPKGRSRRDHTPIPEPGTIGPLEDTPFGETTMSNLEWDS